MHRFLLPVAIGIFLFSFSASAQKLQLDTSLSAEQLVDVLLSNSGVRAGNVTVSGAKGSYGSFAIDTNVIGMKKGIVLSSGFIRELQGPNESGRITGMHLFDPKKMKNPDRDLRRLAPRGNAFDVVTLEFDFIPFSNTISFNYVFGSEEYGEFVGTPFNDAFGFFLSGPGIKRTKSNLAVLPDLKRTPVTINSINDKTNSNYYVDNNIYFDRMRKHAIGQLWLGIRKTMLFWRADYDVNRAKQRKLNQARLSAIQLDGLTTKLTATSVVIPYKKYHIKIMICDVADQAYDSGVFIEGGSFQSTTDTTIKGFQPIPDLSTTLNIDSMLRVTYPPVTVDSLPENTIDERFEITNLLFDFDKYNLPDTVKPQLDSLAAYLVQHPKLHARFDGFTDSKGSTKYNQQLSEQRAKTVMDYLASKGVATTRMSYEGNNSARPVAGNETDHGRALNRRVEIQLEEK